MKPIVRWFQGSGLHTGSREEWSEPSNQSPLCLYLACESAREAEQLDAVVRQLFPDRVCACGSPCSRLVHFNNDPDTTRDQIDKILHYAMEAE